MEKNILSNEDKDSILNDDIMTTYINIPLFEGPKALVNWTQNFNQSINVINSLKNGDILTVKICEVGPGTNSQLRIAWGNEDNQYMSWTKCYENGAPYNYELTLTEEYIKEIKKSGKLYLNGCNITVDNWTLKQSKIISKQRGNASFIIWSGSEIIDQNSSPKRYVKIDYLSFGNAKIGMKLRMNYICNKVTSEGHICKIDWTSMPNANKNEKLASDWGDYYEFNVNKEMLDELRTNGMIVTGQEYTLKSVELINPIKEYLIVSTFNNDDIIAWEKTDGTPKLSVKLTNFEDQEVTTTVRASLITDMFVFYNNYSMDVTLGKNETKTVDLKFPDLVPGFYRMSARANENSLCTYYIGYDPTNIISPDDAQPDFWTFWDNWKESLEAIDMKPKLELINDLSSGSRLIYEIKLMSSPDLKGGKAVPIWGYYAEPKAEGSYPCIIHYHGTDSGNGKPQVPDSDKNIEWCELFISVRGQLLSRIRNGNVYLVNGKNDFYSYGLGNNDEHYYRAAYLDTRRAIDFVWSRTKINKNAIFSEGGSQGGCFTYISAALGDGRIKAIAPFITGHADFIHTMEIVGWPTNKFNEWINKNYPNNYEEGKTALLKHQSYFDTKNFVSRVTCPVLTNFSLQDNVDGPHLNISPYNLLTKVSKEDKKYIINQFLGHSQKSGWETDYLNFFQKYIDKHVININNYKFETYFNSVASKLPPGMKAGTIDKINNLEKKVVINWRYDGNDNDHNIIPGRTAVILRSDPGNYKLELLPNNKEENPKENLLHGCDVRTKTTGGDKYYKLVYNPYGFKYVSDNGSAFVIEDHKSWLALSNQQALDANFFNFEEI